MAEAVRRVLLYADDLALLAETPEQLQQLLDCLSEFRFACRMTVNISKSEIVCFNRGFAPRTLPKWIVNGLSLPVVEVFKYLGIPFEQSGKGGGVHQVGANQHLGARSALYAMWRRCSVLKLHNVRTICHLFDALVRPIASYGCEIWAPDTLCKNGMARGAHHELLDNTFVTVHPHVSC